MLTIKETNACEVTKITCPNCGERLKNVGLMHGSNIFGMAFRCKRCGKFWTIETK